MFSLRFIHLVRTQNFPKNISYPLILASIKRPGNNLIYEQLE